MSVEPDPIDLHVGHQFHRRRHELGVSQTEFCPRPIGVTFQRVQKYERGTNRVGASRLLRISQALETPVGALFAGLDGAA